MPPTFRRLSYKMPTTKTNLAHHNHQLCIQQAVSVAESTMKSAENQWALNSATAGAVSFFTALRLNGCVSIQKGRSAFDLLRSITCTFTTRNSIEVGPAPRQKQGPEFYPSRSAALTVALQWQTKDDTCGWAFARCLGSLAKSLCHHPPFSTRAIYFISNVASIYQMTKKSGLVTDSSQKSGYLEATKCRVTRSF